MFEIIKRNLFKFFNRGLNTEKEKDNEVNLNVISEKDEINVKELKKVKDPKEKLKIKLQVIARRTKSYRIREKNIKRLVNLFEEK